jgi:hypothetical protein
MASGVLAFAASGSPLPAIGFALGLWLPVWLLGILLRQSRSLDLTIQLAALFGLFFVVGIRLVSSDPAAFWSEVLEPIRENLVESGTFDAARSEELLARISHWMTAALAAAYYFQLIAALFLGRWWQALLFNPGGFGAEFRAFRVGPGVGYLALGLLALVLIVDQALWASELLLLLAPLFLLQGVAVVHGLVAALSVSRAWLIAFYVLLLLSMIGISLGLILTTGLGLVDVWADLRGRVAARNADRD